MKTYRICKLVMEPFAIGAMLHFADPWVSVPFTFIVALDWIGCVILLSKEGGAA